MSVQSFNLGTQDQIIDLNGSSVNFDINFIVKSREGKPFYAVVLDQEYLDSGKQIEYKVAENGEISANILSDQNIYKSYNLLLKADEPCIVDVTIDKKIIEPRAPEPQIPNQIPNQIPTQNQVEKKPLLKKINSINWKTIIIILVIVIGAGLLLYFYFKGDKTTKKGKKTESIDTKISEVSSPLSTYSDKSSLSKAIDDISPSPN